MQINEILNAPESIDIQYLKDNITEDQLLLLYWYVLENENNFTNEQLAGLYEFFYELDSKLKDIENNENETDSLHP